MQEPGARVERSLVVLSPEAEANLLLIITQIVAVIAQWLVNHVAVLLLFFVLLLLLHLLLLL